MKRDHVYLVLAAALALLPGCPLISAAGWLLGSGSACDPAIEICCPGGQAHCTEPHKKPCFKPGAVCCEFCKESCMSRAPR